MARSVVTPRVLDELIRAKLSGEPLCMGVRPLPVAWRKRNGDGCNWVVPGWTGDSAAVLTCTERLRPYLATLRQQFDVPEEG